MLLRTLTSSGVSCGEAITLMQMSAESARRGSTAAQVINAELEKYPAARRYCEGACRQGEKNSAARDARPLR
jgi:hypothetical protein